MRHSNPLAFLALVSLTAAACTDTTRAPSPVANTTTSGSDSLVVPSALQNDSQKLVKILRHPNDGNLVRVHGEFVSSEQQPEAAARTFLRRHAGLFELSGSDTDLALTTTRQGLAGTYLRFQQQARNLPVFGAEVIVLVTKLDGRHIVREVNLAHRRSLSFVEPRQDIGSSVALEHARTYVGSPVERAAPEVTRGIGDAPAGIVYRVRISAETPLASWEVFIDAGTGTLISMRDRIKRVTGTALVFDPNPLASTGDFSFVDNNDATTAALDAARYAVSLPNLDGSGFTRGSWVDVHTKVINQRVQSPTNTFEFDRFDPGFEQANAYYHIDRTQTRIQALGILNANGRQQEALSDGETIDNSYYDPQTLQISFGTGGVDDAEDADVVVHEYGHAIQDNQVPDYGSGNQSGAMGEGFGDYLAGSMDRLLSHKIDDPYAMAEWDATSYDDHVPPYLRRLDSKKHYPEHFVNEVHDDGEMWAAATTALDIALGADVMNPLVIEAHFSHSITETFFGASQSILDVDTMIFGGTHQDVIRRRFIKQGLSRILSTPSPLTNVLMSVTVSIDNPRSGSTYPNNLDDEQTFTHPGAQALRLHFTQIRTQTGTNCVGVGCDNIYLTDAAGDLYQILFGNSNNIDSIAIPGDTVNIRLVTNGSVRQFGYHIDRIDILDDGGSSSSSSGMGGMDGGVAGAGGMSGMGGMGGMGPASSSSSSSSSSSGTGAGGMGGMGTGAGGAGNATSSSSSSSSGDGGKGGAGTGGDGTGGTGTGGTAGVGGTAGSAGAGGVGGSGGIGGAGGTGGTSEVSSSSGTSTSSSSSSSSGTPDPNDSDGCGCRAVGDDAPSAPFTLAGAIAALFVWRRRRSS